MVFKTLEIDPNPFIMRRKLFVIGLLGLILAPLPTWGQSPAYRPGYLIVKVQPAYGAYCSEAGLAIPGLQEVLARWPGIQVQQAFPQVSPPVQARSATGESLVDLSRIYYLHFDAEQLSVAQAQRQVAQHPALAYVEPWYRHETFYQPNDPAADTTGGFGGMWHLDQIRARQAWDLQRGDSSVVVGVVDSGTGDHPDLQDNWALNVDDPIDGLDNDGDGYLDNYLGWDFGGEELGGLGDRDPVVGNTHGTHVTGIIGATADNGIGLPGVCFNCRYLPVKASSDDASGYIYYGYQGVVYAALQGAQVINCSWGSAARSRFGEDAIQFATVNRGAAVIAACGNSGTDFPFYPAAYDQVISVANSSYGDTTFSNTTYHYSVDVAAPGWQIYSTLGHAGYHRWGSTSASAPVVAGAVALVKSYFPQYTGYQAAQRLRITADDIYAQNPDKPDKLGQGRINMFRALTDPAQPAIRQVNVAVRDLDGDQAFRPGDELELGLTLVNHLDPGGQLRIDLTAAQEATPYVEVLEGSQAIGAVAARQVFSPAQRFRLRLKNDLPYDHRLYLRVGYTDPTTQYEDFEYISVVVNPSYLDITENQLYTSVNSQGNFGWNDFVAQQQGQGVRYQNRDNVLFEGGLLLGARGKVADRVRNDSSLDQDFRILSPIEQRRSGRVAPFEAVATYDDAFMPGGRLGLEVQQETFAFDRPEWQNFVLMRYTITNRSATPIDTLRAGLFADWDIAPYPVAGQGFKTDNACSYDAAERMTFAYDLSGEDPNYYGLALLSEQSMGAYALVNEPGVRFGDSLKYQALRNRPTPLTASAGVTDGGADVLQFISAQASGLGPNQKDTIAFALMASGSFSQLVITRGEALRAYRCEVLGQAPDEPFTWDQSIIRVGDTVRFQGHNSGAIAWEWDFGDGAVGSGAHPVHVFAKSGEYPVTLRVDDGYCQSDLSQVIEVQAATQLSTADPGSLELYPNPTSTQLNIRAPLPTGPVSLRLWHPSGQLVRRYDAHHPGATFQHQLALGDLPAGLYLLEIQAAQGPAIRETVVVGIR